MTRVIGKTLAKFRKVIGFEALVPHLYETLELCAEFFLQLRNRWDIAALV
jgi:hypothetical protein